MVLRAAFWGLVVLDSLGILLLFILGLAAAGSSRTSPVQVTLLLLVLPCIPLAASVVLFLRSASPVGRGVALLLAASPLVILVSGRAIAEAQLRLNTNESGQLTFFRSGSMREIAEAIARNDAPTVASLLPKVDVNKTGLSDMTLLLLATRQLRETPTEHEVLRVLLAAGADPNKAAQYEFPLAIAIQQSGKSGIEPVKLMLDAGAKPNLKTTFGDPVFFDAIGVSSSLETLALLIDRGADVNLMGHNESNALINAAIVRNWKAVLLLLDRGADPNRGKSVNGVPFRNLVDAESGSQSGDSAYVAVRQRLK
ncbi:MAG TPA: ankyrin repeat domain-containing protein [Gemmatimonadaceae bacterium]|nr:ankyrin repeat domain-containing protein [Gemmatimonadaceae bacterium]